jgi:hypothetical protein
MIVPLLQSTYHHHRNHALTPLHEHRHPASMNRILAPTIPQPILPREQRLIPAIELVMQLPRAAPKPNDALPLPRDPEVVIERRSRVRDLYIASTTAHFTPQFPQQTATYRVEKHVARVTRRRHVHHARLVKR